MASILRCDVYPLGCWTILVVSRVLPHVGMFRRRVELAL